MASPEGTRLDVGDGRAARPHLAWGLGGRCLPRPAPADASVSPQAAGPSGTKMQLLETAFSRTVPALIELHLLQQDSIPAFLSALTLDLFSRQTLA